MPLAVLFCWSAVAEKFVSGGINMQTGKIGIRIGSQTYR